MIFANINLQSLTNKECFKKVGEFVQSGKYHYQISVNAAKVVAAQKDEKLLKIINAADIVNADGMPIKIITDLMFKRKTTRMGGLDYMDGLAKEYPQFNYYFFGGTQEVVEKVVEYYKTTYNLNIVGWRNGYFSDEELVSVVEDINSKGTDVLYIALGTPAKEYMLYDLKERLKCKFAVGVGGAFNIVAGAQKRAPLWMQNASLEWFYRFIQEPRRMWKRYLISNLKFMMLVIKEALRKTVKSPNLNTKSQIF